MKQRELMDKRQEQRSVLHSAKPNANQPVHYDSHRLPLKNQDRHEDSVRSKAVIAASAMGNSSSQAALISNKIESRSEERNRHRDSNSKKPKSANQRRKGPSRVDKPKEEVVISHFDKLEQARFRSYEIQDVLQQLVNFIGRQAMGSRTGSISDSQFVTLSSESWAEIKKLVNEASEMHQEASNDWNSIVDSLNSDLNESKAHCQNLKERLQSIRNDRLFIQRDHEETLKNIASAYNQNRTQLFTVIDDWELAVHQLKNGIEQRGTKQMNYINQLDKDMEDAVTEYYDYQGGLNIGGFSTLETNRNEEKVITPRSAQLGRRGRSQQPVQKEQRTDVLPPQHPNLNHNSHESKKAVNIPLLPIHMINNNNHKDSNQNSSRGLPPVSSNRGSIPIGPQPQAQLSNRQHSSRRHLPPTYHTPQQLSQRGGNVSQRSNVHTGGPNSGRGSSRGTSNRGGVLDSKRSIQGGIIDGEYLVNPAFLGAVYQTSKFDKNLEDEFEGADQTLPFETDRLKQFGEEYLMLMHIEDEEQRILVKQVLFMNHEKELKAQAKQEKAQRALLRKAQQKQRQQNSLDGTTPRGQVSQRNSRNDENEQTLKDSEVRNQQQAQDGSGSRRGQSEMKQYLQDNSMISSHISMHQKLPMLGTQELISARRREMLNDVELNQLLDVSSDIQGLIKTATEKSIILKIEQEFKQKEDLLKEDRKVLAWSSHGGGTDNEDSYISVGVQGPKMEGLLDGRMQDRQLVRQISASNLQQEPFAVHLDNQNLKQGSIQENSKMKINSKLGFQPIFVGELSPVIGEGYEGSPEASISPSLMMDLNSKVPQQSYKDNNKHQQVPGDEQSLYQNQDQLEIIHERQSELSSSINTNNRWKQHSRLSSQRNSKMAMQGPTPGLIQPNNFFMIVPQAPYSARRMKSEKKQRSTNGDASSARDQQICQQSSVADSHRSQAAGQPSISKQHQFAQPSDYSVARYVESDIEKSAFRDDKYKRCKSHRNSLQSAPNSQRGSKPTSKNPAHQSDINNFNSLLIEDSVNTEDQAKEDLIAVFERPNNAKASNNHKRNQRPMTDLAKREPALENYGQTLSSDDLSLEDIVRRNQELDKHHRKFFAKRHSPHMINEPVLNPQHFSSIQNQFEESKTSGFKNNDSLFIEDVSDIQYHKRPRSVSDRGEPEGTEGCDLDENELNQLQKFCFKYQPFSSLLRDTDKNQSINDERAKSQSPFQTHQNSKIQPSSQSLRHHFLHNNGNNITSSLLPLGNQSNQSAHGLLFPTNTQKHNNSNLLQSRRFTANMITKYLLQNFTQLRNAVGQQTREAPTSGKQNGQKTGQIHGQSGFTLSTLGDETLMYMFPAQKTSKRTLFMLQNFHNNYYTNQAGVLFTMPISELNNGFLQQCSTIPSGDPGLCTGGMTNPQLTQQQSRGAQKNKHSLRQNQTNPIANIIQGGGTQDSMTIKEDSNNNLIAGLQKYYMPQFFNDRQQQMTNPLSKNNGIALSTGESGTLKSTVLAANNLRFNPQAFTQITQIGQSQSLQIPINGGTANELNLSPRNETKEEEKIQMELRGDLQRVRASSQNTKPNSFKRANIKVQKLLELHPVQENESAPVKSNNQPRPQSSIVQFNRNIKVMPVNGQVHAGLAKLQALAGNAHHSITAQGGANFIVKKPSLRLNRSNIQGSSVNTSSIVAADVSGSDMSMSFQQYLSHVVPNHH